MKETIEAIQTLRMLSGKYKSLFMIDSSCSYLAPFVETYRELLILEGRMIIEYKFQIAQLIKKLKILFNTNDVTAKVVKIIWESRSPEYEKLADTLKWKTSFEILTSLSL